MITEGRNARGANTTPALCAISAAQDVLKARVKFLLPAYRRRAQARTVQDKDGNSELNVCFAVHVFANFGRPRAFRRTAGFANSVLLVLLNPNILLIDLIFSGGGDRIGNAMRKPLEGVAALFFLIAGIR